jgi:undecaprenyl-diphosphatase
VRLAAGWLTRRSADRRLVAALAVGTLPAAAAGVLFEDVIATRLHSATVVAVSSIGWGLVLWLADRQVARARIHDVEGIGIGRALAIGGAQALALIPGTSRSGITLSAGLFTRLDRPTAARFAFLLGLPITAAAAVIKTASLLHGGLSAPALAAPRRSSRGSPRCGSCWPTSGPGR